MNTRQAKLSSIEYQNLGQIETSIQYHINRHAAVSMEARKILDAVDALYTARNQIMDKVYKEAGIDGNTVQAVSISKDPEGGGIVMAQCAEPLPVTMPVMDPVKSNETTGSESAS